MTAVVSLPVDRALPQLPSLLDCELMGEILARSLGDGAGTLAVEIEYVENGGVLHYVLRNLARAA